MKDKLQKIGLVLGSAFLTLAFIEFLLAIPVYYFVKGNGNTFYSRPHLHWLFEEDPVLGFKAAPNLKKKNPYISSFAPSLEALEKLGLLALCFGFLCMTFGVLTGLFWAQAVSEKFWSYTEHGLAILFTWVIYVSLLVGRLGMSMSSLKLSIGSFVGFLFLMLAWLGSEVIR